MSTTNHNFVASSSERLNQKSLLIKIGAGILATGALVGGLKVGSNYLHDRRHPEIEIGTQHDDVSELRDLLEHSATSAYASDSSSDIADVELMYALMQYQQINDLPDDRTGKVREGDDTWNHLEDNQVTTPEDLPAACTQEGDVICVVRQNDEGLGDLHVLRDGKEKFRVENVGVGRPSEPSDDGEFSINPTRLEEQYFNDEGIPMPYAMFYNGGEAIHQSPRLAEDSDSYPGSYGCVTIADSDAAEQLFHYTQDIINDGRTMAVVVDVNN